LLRSAAALLIAAALTISALPDPGGALASGPSTAQPRFERPLPVTPEGYEVSAREAKRIADRTAAVAETIVRYGELTVRAEAKPSIWQVGYFSGEHEVAQVHVDSKTGAVGESLTGHQVAWPMARGYEEQFGHKLNAPYVWIPLSLLFVCALLDFQRLRKVVHLDLLVLLSFGVSHVYFNQGEIGLSVPLVLPPLLYLLGRMAWIGFRGAGEGLRPSTPTWVLATFVLALVAARVALNVADSGVIDVGYAGVIGADRITHGEAVYGSFPEENPFGDTYGPANYYAYVPFEAALGWGGSWDELPAAHAAAIFFDLATLAGLFICGRRLFGAALGVALCFAWAAYPYTTFALQSNSNDTLVAALLIWAFAAFSSPLGRGALLGLAAGVKFAPLALAPLFAAGQRGLADGLRSPAGRRALLGRTAVFAACLGGVLALLLAHPAVEPGLAAFWERTIATQLDRTSPFSVWGQEPSLEWLQRAFQVLAIGLALLVAFVPRRRTMAQVAALAAAVMIAVELTADHWFYLYIPWFLPMMLLALCGRRGGGGLKPGRP